MKIMSVTAQIGAPFEIQIAQSPLNLLCSNIKSLRQKNRKNLLLNNFKSGILDSSSAVTMG